ncbi:Serine/threonine-protein phosphatase with EF-hands 1 [Manis javanica]|nr:Serine/threonine-protein phosphatase with EF-hands 1 [Manis javanica]
MPCSKSSARMNTAAQHRDRAATGRGGGRSRGILPGAQGARHGLAQGRRAGRWRGLADDPAGQVLQACAAGRHPGLRHARQGRERAPPDCSNFREMAARNSERVIDVAWGQPKAATVALGRLPGRCVRGGGGPAGPAARYLGSLCARKTNVIGVQTQSVKGTAWMTFTVEVADSGRLSKVLGIVAAVAACVRRGGVEHVQAFLPGR